jgi:hypothetical protein
MSTEHVNRDAAGSGRTLWKPGQSGNPKGRPPGARDRRTVAMEEFINAGPEVALAVVRAAKAGDVSAAALVLARIAPPLKAHAPTVRFNLDVTRGLTEQAAQVLEAVAMGAVDPECGCNLIQAISVYAKLREGDELATRLSHVEAVMRGEPPLVHRVEPLCVELRQEGVNSESDAGLDGESSTCGEPESTSSPSLQAQVAPENGRDVDRAPPCPPRYPPPWQASPT